MSSGLPLWWVLQVQHFCFLAQGLQNCLHRWLRLQVVSGTSNIDTTEDNIVVTSAGETGDSPTPSGSLATGDALGDGETVMYGRGPRRGSCDMQLRGMGVLHRPPLLPNTGESSQGPSKRLMGIRGVQCKLPLSSGIGRAAGERLGGC